MSFASTAKANNAGAQAKRRIPELLSPCGSPEAVKAAVHGGADAVYLAAGADFNARHSARNFTEAEFLGALGYCHAAGVKVYAALNTQLYDRELSGALRRAAFYYKAGADALIVADLGLASLIREAIPDFALHASTQASGHSSDAARAFAALGFSRMVCARELSADNIRALVSASPIEIELFVHGAICVSHSGQCLMSWAMGGRSGNRGECAQPCRLGYNGSHPLSVKDMCLASHIPEIIETGVASLKIEGRLKPPGYVYEVTSVYRRLLDEGRAASPRELSRLAAVFSRSGFTDGYFTNKLGPHMLGIRTALDKSASQAARADFAPCRSVHPPPITITRAEPALPPVPAQKREGARIAPYNTARFASPERLPKAGAAFFAIIYLPLSRYKKAGNNVTGVVLPPAITDAERDETLRLLKKARDAGARYALAGNIGHIALAAACGYEVRGDFRLNICNNYSARIYDALTGALLSPELSLPQIRDISPAASGVKIDKGAVVYGYLPLMLLEKPAGADSLRDRTGAVFNIIKEPGVMRSRDIVLNSVPLYMADRAAELDAAGIAERHFIFNAETPRRVEEIIDMYKKKLAPSESVRRIKK